MMLLIISTITFLVGIFICLDAGSVRGTTIGYFMTITSGLFICAALLFFGFMEQKEINYEKLLQSFI